MSGGLKVTLSGMLAYAACSGGWQTIRLARGLVVSLRIRDHKTDCKLQRSGNRASLTELKTIVGNLPYSLPFESVVYEYDGDGVLVASWATPKVKAQ